MVVVGGSSSILVRSGDLRVADRSSLLGAVAADMTLRTTAGIRGRRMRTAAGTANWHTGCAT